MANKEVFTMTGTEFAAKMEELKAVIAEKKGQRGAVMQTLQQAQNIFGYVPEEVQIAIAEGLGVTLSEVYGVSTFYSQFSLEARGRFVIGRMPGHGMLRKGLAEGYGQGHAGAEHKGRQDHARRTVHAARYALLGACGLAPVMMINDDVYGRLVPDDIPGILAKYDGM